MTRQSRAGGGGGGGGGRSEQIYDGSSFTPVVTDQYKDRERATLSCVCEFLFYLDIIVIYVY